MSELFFLPQWPVRADQLPWYAVLLLVALLVGEALWRLRLPRLLGWILAGIALGPSGLDILDRAALGGLRGLLEIAVGLILSWKVAGYIGVDRWLLPRLGTPWEPKVLVTRRESAGSGA